MDLNKKGLIVIYPSGVIDSVDIDLEKIWHMDYFKMLYEESYIFKTFCSKDSLSDDYVYYPGLFEICSKQGIVALNNSIPDIINRKKNKIVDSDLALLEVNLESDEDYQLSYRLFFQIVLLMNNMNL